MLQPQVHRRLEEEKGFARWALSNTKLSMQ